MRLGQLILIVGLPTLGLALTGLGLGGLVGTGLLLGGLWGMLISFMAGLIARFCYTRRTPTLALAMSLLAMSVRLVSMLATCLILRSAEREFMVSSVLSMTAVLVLALLLDAIFLALPAGSRTEEMTRG
jgi:hypothetical protein